MQLLAKPSIFSTFLSKKIKHKTSLDYYISKFQIKKSDLFIGQTIEPSGEFIPKDNSRAVVEDARLMSKGSLILGGAGSGRLQASVAQLSHSLKNGSGGLVLLNNTETHLDKILGGILSALNRNNDIVVFKLNHYLPESNKETIAHINTIDFDKAVSENKIVFIEGTEKNKDLERYIVTEYFNALSRYYVSCKSKNEITFSASPFIFLDNITSIHPSFIEQQLAIFRWQIGLNPILSYSTLTDMIRQYNHAAYSLFYSLDYKHFMKINNPNEAELIIKKFKLREIGNIGINDLLGNNPGQSIFLHGATAKHIAMAYLDAVYYLKQ